MYAQLFLGSRVADRRTDLRALRSLTRPSSFPSSRLSSRPLRSSFSPFASSFSPAAPCARAPSRPKMAYPIQLRTRSPRRSAQPLLPSLPRSTRIRVVLCSRRSAETSRHSRAASSLRTASHRTARSGTPTKSGADVRRPSAATGLKDEAGGSDLSSSSWRRSSRRCSSGSRTSRGGRRRSRSSSSRRLSSSPCAFGRRTRTRARTSRTSSGRCAVSSLPALSSRSTRVSS